jgi:hypothetical protein
MTVPALLAAVAVLGAPAAQAGSPGETAKPAVAKAPASGRLDVIKKLAGEWVEVGADGNPTDKVVATYRVTAGGTTVEETLFGGTDHEMVTLYHLDGEDLVLTHYCVLGNQPRMKADRQPEPNKLIFRCIGGTNIKSERDEHMHQATLVWKDDNRLSSEWVEFKDGKPAMTVAFNLARR